MIWIQVSKHLKFISSFQIWNNSLNRPKGLATYINECERRLNIKVPRWNQSLNFSYIWLRDHCQCHQCYNEKTSQRLFDINDIPPNLRPLTVHHNEKELVIEWPDEHISKYDFKFLWENSYEGKQSYFKRLTQVLWSKKSFPSLETIMVPSNELSNKKGLLKLVEDILIYGVAIISQVSATEEATREAVENLCMIKKTFFGEVWSFQDDLQYADTAYSNLDLGAHTDNTYFTEPSRIQVFHCLKAAEEGGETLLVDGFHIGDQLQKSSTDSYEFLSNTFIPSEYVDKNEHFKSYHVAFRHHPITRKLVQFRFNMYDRAPLCSIPFEKVDRYYSSLGQLNALVRQPCNAAWIKLQPGLVLLVDNWRVMHGRSGYKGRRIMSGCYLDNDDFCSKVRTLGFEID